MREQNRRIENWTHYEVKSMEELGEALENHGIYAPACFGPDADSFDCESELVVGHLVFDDDLDDDEDSRVEEFKELLEKNGLIHVWAMKDGTWER